MGAAVKCVGHWHRRDKGGSERGGVFPKKREHSRRRKDEAVRMLKDQVEENKPAGEVGGNPGDT